jgi:hypothetical protein
MVELLVAALAGVSCGFSSWCLWQLGETIRETARLRKQQDELRRQLLEQADWVRAIRSHQQLRISALELAFRRAADALKPAHVSRETHERMCAEALAIAQDEVAKRAEEGNGPTEPLTAEELW